MNWDSFKNKLYVNEMSMPTIKGKFKPSQLKALKKEFGRINKIDPSSDSYKKMIQWVDAMGIDMLKQLRDEKIKFLRGTAGLPS